ncbi:MAG: hypothetical protein IJY27_04110 [Clostridia bacterium]|nr:hypothetical protein [Clostridia bacterium]
MKRKIVTMCGSLKFLDKIQETAERLELQKQYVVISINPHVLDRALAQSERELLGELHRAKIDISDAIFVVNVGGYIGDAVRREIEYAASLGKEIIYLEND